MSAPRTRKVTTRSRNGCWTCRARRKKCDEKRPFCTPCERKSLQCSGYGPRLKWGNGVASRGYLMGSAIPVHPRDVKPASTTAAAAAAAAAPSSSPSVGGHTASSKGARSPDAGLAQFMGVLDFSAPPAAPSKTPDPKADSKARDEKDSKADKCDAVQSSPSVAASSSLNSSAATAIPLSPFDEELFEEFKEWGSQYLAQADSLSPFRDIIAFCAESRSLVANCLAFQLTLHPEHEDKFEDYYATCLRLFREDVCDPVCAVKDATLIAGILLCSIGMNRCMKWTIHLNGLYSIIQCRNSISPPSFISSDILDSIGFYDLPTHVLGRATRPLHIWRDYCRGKPGIEPNSNMPFSLIDLFSMVGQPGIEALFWSWTWEAGQNAHPPSRLTRLAWDATRLAGIVAARDHRLINYRGTDLAASNPYQPSQELDDGCPPTALLIEAILTNIATILRPDPQHQQQQHNQNQSQSQSQETYEVLNLLLYPAFVAGTQHALLTPLHKRYIEDFWQELFPDMGADGAGTPHLQIPLDILRDLWRDARGRTADMIAKERGVEIGLF